MAYLPETPNVGPVLEPVTLDEVKKHLRIDHDHDDGLLYRYIAAARRDCERFRGKSLITQTWRYYIDQYPSDRRVRLPMPPVQSITSVTSIEEDGTETVFSASEYQLADERYVVLATSGSWPSITLRAANGVQIEYVAGYGDSPADIPAHLREWILLRIGDFYAHRESTVVGTIETRLGFVDQLASYGRDWEF